MRVVLTRSREASPRLAEALRREGFEVDECPLIRIERIDGQAVRTEGYDWVVLTSRAGVEALFARLAGSLPPVAALGPGTADALRKHGVEPALVARESTQEGLLAEMPNSPGRVLFAGAEGARGVLARALEADFVALYRTIAEHPKAFPDCDLVVLASASAARAFAALELDIPCVSIGPITTAEADRHGVRIVAEAATHDLEGLVQAVKLVASSTGSSPS